MTKGGGRYYIVSFELNAEAVGYDQFFQVLEAFTGGLRLLPSVWLIRASMPTEHLALTLLRNMGTDDRLMLAECSPERLWMFGTSELNDHRLLGDIG